ncbi:MAG TPA: hypothetical protein VG940_00985, partial [Gemmatimonadales bacterium]|nr:hypothetical protein [Gemmatimonadales bacterium]
MESAPQLPAQWSHRPLVYFWTGGWIGVGASIGVVAPHSHHAVQVTLGLSGQIRFQGPEGPWHDYEGAVIRPNVTHS